MHSDVLESISFRLDLAMDTTLPYTLILVWAAWALFMIMMTLTLMIMMIMVMASIQVVFVASGCHEGAYGDRCDQPCGDHCEGACDRVTGHCPGQ